MYTTYYPKFPIQDCATGNNWLLKKFCDCRFEKPEI